MEGPRDDHTKRSKSDRNKCQIPYDITHMQNLKYDTNELIYKTEVESQMQKTNSWLPGDKGGDG